MVRPTDPISFGLGFSGLVGLINSTQLAGLIAFTLAALVTWYAARRSTPARRRAWQWAAAAYALMFAEVVFGARHIISKAIGNLFRVEGVYDERRPFQAAVIVVLLALIWIGFAWAFAGRKRQGWQLDLSHAAIFIAFNVFPAGDYLAARHRSYLLSTDRWRDAGRLGVDRGERGGVCRGACSA